MNTKMKELSEVKVYVMTKAKLFEPERYVGVAKSMKSAEKEFRRMFPNMRQDSSGAYTSDSSNTWLLFIKEDELKE